MEQITKYRPSATIFLLGLVSLFADTSSEIYFAILPFYIIELGGSGVAIGLVAGATELFLSVLKGAFGFISDKLAQGRKKFLYLGYGLPSVFKFLMALVTTWPAFLVFRLGERIGKGVRSAPRDAMIAEQSKPEELGRNFGFHRAMDTLGSVIGSIAAFVLILFIPKLSTFFIIAAIVGLLTLIPIKLVKEPAVSQVETKENKYKFRSFPSQGVKPGYWRFMVLVVFFNLSLVSYMFFLLIPSNTAHVQQLVNLSIIQIATLLYAFFNIVYSGFSYYAGSRADSHGKQQAVMVGFLLYLVSLLFFISTVSIVTLLLGFIFLGLSYAFTEGNFRAIIGEYVVEGFKASGYGVYLFVSGMSLFLGNLLAGFLYDINAHWVFLPSIGFIIISMVLMRYYISPPTSEPAAA